MKLTIIRGVPGSGKTTLARTLNAVHLETDMFMNPNHGAPYRYNRFRLDDAHAICEEKTREALAAGKDVVVSNTFIRLWEVDKYLHLAREFGAAVEVIDLHNRFRNTRGVPPGKVAQMRKDFEPYRLAT